jgi:hypothetical protein
VPDRDCYFWRNDSNVYPLTQMSLQMSKSCGKLKHHRRVKFVKERSTFWAGPFSPTNFSKNGCIKTMNLISPGSSERGSVLRVGRRRPMPLESTRIDSLYLESGEKPCVPSLLPWPQSLFPPRFWALLHQQMPALWSLAESISAPVLNARCASKVVVRRHARL